jgi:hypothetical protein
VAVVALVMAGQVELIAITRVAVAVPPALAAPIVTLVVPLD